MKFFKAIGAFFAKIGRWIRDTAWVQPLLIVGGIFAIIFSIPYLTKWVKSWFNTGDAAEKYYEKNQLKWKNVDNSNSEVDKLLTYMTTYTSAEEAKKAHPTEYKKYGEKFFLNFVKKDCPDCKNNYYGFKKLGDSWGKGEFKFEDTKESYKVFNIYIDTQNSGKDYFYFQKFICGYEDSAKYNEVFDDASTIESNYVQKNYTSDSVRDAMFNAEGTFQAPCTFLVDFTATAPSYTLQNGISEIFFNNNGKDGSSSPSGKARLLWDCWNHIGEFGSESK